MIEETEVRHFLGYPSGREPPGRIQALVEELLPRARELVQARGAVLELPVDRARDVGLRPVAADRLVLGLVTIGPQLEAWCAQLQAEGDPTRALLVDAMGSAAVEEAADRLGAALIAEPEGPTTTVSCRVSPGYGRWNVDSQRRVFALLPVAELGVSLSEGCMMTPRKSISFALWPGAEASPGAGLSGCARCGLETCRYRRVPGGAGQGRSSCHGPDGC